MSIRILLVDDHQIVRDGLRALIAKEADLEVVGEAENGRDAVRQAKDLRPDVVVMDVTMPDLNGVEATRRIRWQNDACRVLALSVHADRQFMAEMLKAGASGYLLKDCAFEDLVNGIRTVMEGRTYIRPARSEAAGDLAAAIPPTETTPAPSILTPREREVLQLLAEGHGTKQIARRLHVSPKTIDTHRQHIMNKLGLRTVAKLTKYAIRHGLTGLEH